MALVCSISGQVPEEPVISKNGYIFERRLIERIISETGLCPITNSALSVEDLRPVVSAKHYQAGTINSASLPEMIKAFESGWDRLLIENSDLKAQLQSSEEKLALSLYEQEAAVRLTARLVRERDQALEEINRLQEEVAQIQYSKE